MAPQDDLWAELHDHFDTDDGSLPEVVFADPTGGAIQPLFAFLVERGVIEDGVQIWDSALEAPVPLAGMPNAGERVVNGQIPAFHVVLEGIEVDGTALPPLGVFFCEDEVALDYRMGPEWTPSTLAAFARLLHALHALAPGASLYARAETTMPANPHFRPALDRYLAALEAD